MTTAELAEQMRITNRSMGVEMRRFSIAAIPVLRASGATIRAMAEAYDFERVKLQIRVRYLNDPFGSLGFVFAAVGERLLDQKYGPGVGATIRSMFEH